jgi:hypothetical protein
VSDPLAIYGAAFSTGAIDINNTLAGFSSRGPSTFYTPNLLKPEISAPGVNVRSSYVTGDTAYNSFSGTSMASPHVAGVVALLWSARPQLVRDIVATKTVLENTANPGVTVNPAQTCGGTPSTTIPNNSFGYGRVDVLAAVNAVPTSTPTPTPTSTPTPTPPATAGADLYTLTSCRIADTRNAPGPLGGPALSAGGTRNFPVAGVCGVSPTAKAVAVTLTVVFPTDYGHLTLYPADTTLPLASTINFRSGIVRASNAVLRLGVSGQISVFCGMPSGTVDFILDVTGYFE